MKPTAVALAVLFLMSGVAHAQAEQAPLLIPPGWRRAGGLHVGFPVIVSVAMGVQRIAFRGQRTDLMDNRRVEFFMVGEPGIGASRVSAGWMYVGYDSFGYGLRLSTMWQYRGDHMLGVGPEITMMKGSFLGMRFGLFRRIVGNSPLVVAAIDLGFMY